MLWFVMLTFQVWKSTFCNIVRTLCDFNFMIGTLLGLSLEQDFTMNDFKHRLANFSQTVSCTFTDMFVFKIFTIMTLLLS